MGRILTAKEAAGILRYHPQTMWRKIRRGEIRGVERHGRSIRIVEDELRRFHVAHTNSDECKQK
jgi:excisionase family DNA binding protein